MLKKIGIVIQARTGSTRLPNKMVIPFYDDKSLIEVVIENLLQIFHKEQIVLATTTNPKDDGLVSIAKASDISVFRGSEDNVLDRFIKTAEHYGFSHLVRICADNPFLIKKQLEHLVKCGQNLEADYVAYFFENGLPSIKTHSGFFAEWVSVEALKKVASHTNEKLYVEHVTNFIYANPELFSIEKISVPDQEFCGKVRLTIDTIDDFEICKNIYAILYRGKGITLESIKEIVLSNSMYLEKMQTLINQQTK